MARPLIWNLCVVSGTRFSLCGFVGGWHTLQPVQFCWRVAQPSQPARQPPNLCRARLQPCRNVSRTNTASAAGLLEIGLPRGLNRLRKNSTFCHSEARCAPRNLSFPVFKGPRFVVELWMGACGPAFVIEPVGHPNFRILTQSGRTAVVFEHGAETPLWNSDVGDARSESFQGLTIQRHRAFCRASNYPRG